MRKNAAKKIFSLLLAITVALGVIPFTAVTRSKAANETYSTEDFEYVIRSDNTITITKCINTTDEVITIPEEIDGYTVKEIYYNGSADTLFPTENTSAKHLNIPKSVTRIYYAGLKHSTLEYINVDKENPKFASDENGILYSKDFSVLYTCPNALQTDELIIPDSVKSYDNSAKTFYSCNKIKRIVFPQSATEILCNFSNCTALESIKFPNTAAKSNSNINFYNCEALKAIDLSKIESPKLSNLAFYNCISLESVAWNSEISSIPMQAFMKCTSLKSIDLLNAEVEISQSAFKDCTALTTVSGTENVTRVGSTAFTNCNSLTQISFGEKLTDIDEQAFLDCTALSEVSVPDTDTVIRVSRQAFRNTSFLNDADKYENGGLYLGKNLISVQPNTSRFTFKSDTLSTGNGAFAGQKSLTSIELPDSLQYIGDYTFSGCSALEGIVIPDSVTRIGEYAFSSTGIKEIVIPDNVRSLGIYCFYNSKLENITLPQTDIVLGSSCLSQTALKTVVLPTDITTIPSGLLANSSITSITVPDSVKRICLSAFINCKSLETIIIPENVTVIEEAAFKSCTKLEKISLPNVQDIQENAFSGCTSLKEVKFGNSLTKIGRSAFTGCESLTSISIPKSVTSIGDSAFNNYLKTVYFEGTKAEWEAITFGINNTPLQQAEIIFNSTGEVIPDEPTENIIWSFDSSDGHLYISGEGEMSLRDSTSDYEWYSFRNRIRSVTVEDAVTSIASNAFLGFENLREISFGEGVKSIGTNAFANCPELSLITFNGSPESIASGAFLGCNKNMTVIGENGLGKDFAETNGFNYIPVSFDSEKKILGFGGTLTIYKELPYSFIVDFVLKYSQAEYLHFEKLVFDGVVGDTISMDNVDPSANYLTLNNLYVSLKSVDGEQISFAKMLELLENGDYDAFKYVVKDDSGEQEEPSKPGNKNFFEKLGEQFDKIVTGALKTLSKVANFFRKLFK